MTFPIDPRSPGGDWKDAVIEALIVNFIYRAEHENNPELALHDLIAWEVEVALDPLVSSDAAELIQRGIDKTEAMYAGFALVPVEEYNRLKERDWMLAGLEK